MPKLDFPVIDPRQYELGVPQNLIDKTEVQVEDKGSKADSAPHSLHPNSFKTVFQYMSKDDLDSLSTKSKDRRTPSGVSAFSPYWKSGNIKGFSPPSVEPWIPPMVYGVAGAHDLTDTKSGLSVKSRQRTTPQDMVSKGTNEIRIPLSSSFFSSVLKEQGLPSLTQSIQSKGAIKKPGFDVDLPDGVAMHISKLKQHETDVVTADENPAVIIQVPTLESRYGTEYFALDKVNGQFYVVSPDDKWEKILKIAQKVSSYSMTPIRASDEISKQTLPSLSGMNKMQNAESTRLSQQVSDVTSKASLTKQQLMAYYIEQATKKLVQEVMSEALREDQNDQEEIKKKGF